MKEIFKPIGGYEGLYEVSNMGHVRSLDRICTGTTKRKIKGKMLALNLNEHGYPCVDLSKDGKKRTTKVHQLVAKAFIPNPFAYPVVNHIDSNPSNNVVSNLEWCSQSHNIKHSFDTGRHRRPQTLLTSEQITFIKENYSRYSRDMNFKVLGEMFGVDRGVARYAYYYL